MMVKMPTVNRQDADNTVTGAISILSDQDFLLEENGEFKFHELNAVINGQSPDRLKKHSAALQCRINGCR
jgi:hypothetical protein